MAVKFLLYRINNVGRLLTTILQTSSTSISDKTVESITLGSPADFHGLFDDRSKPANKDEDAKVRCRQRLTIERD